MREELGIVRHDPVFEKAWLRRAARACGKPMSVGNSSTDAAAAAEACAQHIFAIVEETLSRQAFATLAIPAEARPG